MPASSSLSELSSSFEAPGASAPRAKRPAAQLLTSRCSLLSYTMVLLAVAARSRCSLLLLAAFTYGKLRCSLLALSSCSHCSGFCSNGRRS
ncbi:hypothetical protein OAO87_01125 [bacterium]|nr:hypothetical protein [bacterium]